MPLKIEPEPSPMIESPPDLDPFQVSANESASGYQLVLSGRINLDAAIQLNEAALAALSAGKPVSLDWCDAESVSAGALQVLLALRRALVARGQSLSIAGDNPDVRRTLEMAGLAKYFPVAEAG